MNQFNRSLSRWCPNTVSGDETVTTVQILRRTILFHLIIKHTHTHTIQRSKEWIEEKSAFIDGSFVYVVSREFLSVSAISVVKFVCCITMKLAVHLLAAVLVCISVSSASVVTSVEYDGSYFFVFNQTRIIRTRYDFTSQTTLPISADIAPQASLQVSCNELTSINTVVCSCLRLFLVLLLTA